MEGLKQLIDKKVYVELSSGRRYSGVLKSIDEESSPVVFVSIIDKFGELVMFAKEEIKLIQEER